MKKLLVGLAAALLLASCAYTPAQQASAPQPQNANAGHPTPDYPGPRLY